MEGCGMTTIKYLLFIFNFIFSICGIAVITVGIIAIVKTSGLKQYQDGGILASAIVLIIIGVIIFAVAFFGCCGAIKESFGLLIAFAVALSLIFVIELAIGIAGAVLKSQIGDALQTELKRDLNNYQDKKNQELWDTLQSELKCCGVNGSSDWNEKMPDALPKSCCNNTDPCTKEAAYQKGCLNVMKEKISASATILIAVAAVIALIEVAGVVLSCCLASAIKKEK